jgi:hypothetical protein
MLAVDSVPPRRWTFIKQNLAAFPGLALVTQDGDGEGVIRLLRLPTPVEAAEIRQVAGIRQTRDAGAAGFHSRPAKTGDTGTSIRSDGPPAHQGTSQDSEQQTAFQDEGSAA